MRLRLFLLAIAAAAPAIAAEPDYLRQVKPLLAGRCYACHGALKQEAGLRLDTAELVRKGSDSGPVAKPGKSAESSLIERVTHADPEVRMPPEGEGAPLTAGEVALLRAWIDAGAQGPAEEKPEADPREHWAFRAPVRPEMPLVKNTAQVANPIDAFLLAEMDARGLMPQKPADKRLLLRRASLDLIGLPPTENEFAQFLADDSPLAYERAIDRLLAAPQYGERWGRHWMDIWRYSDWWGLGAEVRNSQKHIWHWRDWVVESVNEDVGYDEMVRQMLAADELYPADLSKLRATGYLARQYFKFNRNSWIEETIEHTGKAFLGLTLNCCRCHDHKYDPVSQVEYFRFRAIFEPYQIRTEQIAGQPDYEQDGIPRAFDCNLDVPTYRFIRGDDKRPVKDEPLTPGLPKLLLFDDFAIQPVPLPPEAHQPGLRPFVLDNQLALAEKQISTAQAALEAARKGLAEAELAARKLTESKRDPGDSLPASDKPLVSDDFAAADPARWKSLSGDWKYAEGALHQLGGSETRSVYQLLLDPPQDFEARFTFTPTGGRMWKSVGLAFDLEGEQDVLAYISAYAGGPKVQVTFKQQGNYVYPPEAAQARALKLQEKQDVLVRVRGTLVNVDVNGEPAIAYRLPIERQRGKLALVTYDAQAKFHRFELSALGSEVKLREPAKVAATATPAKPASVEEAQAAVGVAGKALAAAQLLPDTLRARAVADRARWQSPPADNAGELAKIAAQAERALAHAKAQEELVKAELELFKAADEKKRPAAEKKVAAAKTAVDNAAKALESPGEAYTPLSGALKTLESNLETEASRTKPYPTTSTGRRTALAKWLTDRRNPLAARVAVNHIWMRHMGTPLVPTVFDFGRKGTPPTHPALLDWLAVEFMENGWSMKHLHRLIVTSNAYRRSSSSAGMEANLAIDADNRWYWRHTPTRMEAQVLRDSLLYLAGDLDLTRGGPNIPAASEAQSRRRGLYFTHSHNEHPRFASMFDDANVLECYRREQSIVPQQALALANSRLSLEVAEKIAAKLPADSQESFVIAAFRLLLASEPAADELAAAKDALEAWQKSGSNETRARANLVQALLNHNDFVTVR
jgi:hypothetical protein